MKNATGQLKCEKVGALNGLDGDIFKVAGQVRMKALTLPCNKTCLTAVCQVTGSLAPLY